jgi:hypothetical protein
MTEIKHKQGAYKPYHNEELTRQATNEGLDKEQFGVIPIGYPCPSRSLAYDR